MELQDFMRLDIFQARLDEFSGCDYKTYCRACKKILLKYGAKGWGDISELQLGKVFTDLKNEVIKRTLRQGFLRKIS